MKILIKIFFIILILAYTKNISAQNENKILFSISDEIFTTIDLNNRLKYINIKENKLIKYDEGILNDFISALLFDKHFEELNIENDYNDIINKKLKEIKNNINNINDNDLNKILKEISEKEIKKNLIYDFKRKIIIENELQKKKELIFNNNLSEINNIYEINIRLISLNKYNTYEITKEIPLDEIIEDLKRKKIDYLYKEKKLNFTEKIDNSLKISIINNSNYFYINNMIYGEIIRKIKDEESIKFSIYQIKTYIELSSDDLICKKIKKISNKNIDNSLKISIINNSNYFYIKNMIYGEIIRKIKDEESIKFSIYQIKTYIDLSPDDLVCKKIKKISNKEINIIENKNVPYKKLNEIIKQNLIMINDYINIKDNNNNNYIVLCAIYYEDKIFENINTNHKINFLAKKIEKNIKNILSKKYKLKYL